MNEHIMLDLETFGTKPGSVLRSIGAVAFDLSGKTGVEFYRNISEQSCLDAGLTKDQSTVDWWAQQSPESQTALLIDPQPLPTVVAEFHRWFSVNGVYVWSHGANFDEPLWQAASRAVGQTPPWKFWNSRCTRTTYHIMNFDPRSVARQGTYHNALDDAKYQAQCVSIALNGRSK